MKRTRSGLDSGIIILSLIVVVIVAAVIILVVQLRTDDVAEAIREEEPIAVAFLVSDDEKLLCTEVLLYHPRTAKAALFDVPGEWGDVLEESDRMDRIDRLYEAGNPDEFLEKISVLLDLDISWKFELGLEEVELLVDLLEGLELFIANPVEMIGEQITLLPSGSLVLDGAKVRAYLSFEDPEEADLDRRARYQKFVQALLKRLGSRTEYLERDEVFRAFEGYVSTDMSTRALRSFVGELSRLNADYLVPKHVHGDRVRVDDQVLLFPHYKGNLIRESIRQTLDSLANVEVIGEEELVVTLKILNGTEKSGLASRTSQLFGDFGYDVLPASNADRNDYEHTMVISHSGNLSEAQQIANLIRCSRIEVEEQTSAFELELSGQDADVTIILGMDFDGRYCKE